MKNWDKKELEGYQEKPLDKNHGGAEEKENWNAPVQAPEGAGRKTELFKDVNNKDMVWTEKAWKFSGHDWKGGKLDE